MCICVIPGFRNSLVLVRCQAFYLNQSWGLLNCDPEKQTPLIFESLKNMFENLVLKSLQQCTSGFPSQRDSNVENVSMSRWLDGLMQERRNSTANALELHLSRTNPLMWSWLASTNIVSLLGQAKHFIHQPTMALHTKAETKRPPFCRLIFKELPWLQLLYFD